MSPKYTTYYNMHADSIILVTEFRDVISMQTADDDTVLIADPAIINLVKELLKNDSICIKLGGL